MSTNEREALGVAVKEMVKATNGPELLRNLNTIAHLGQALGTDFVPLAHLALRDFDAYGRVITLIESKRVDAGMPPLVPPPKEGFDKTDYQRDFMAQKRERERRAATIENLMRPESSQLKGRSRLDFMQLQSKKWKEQRDAMLASVKAKRGRSLRVDEIKEVLSQFWDKVDEELQGLEELARAEKTHKVRRG